MKTVAVFRNNFLPLSETFIHDELRHHEKYRPVVFARKILNTNAFPGHEVISLDDSPAQSTIYGLTGLSTKFFNKFNELQPDIIHAHFGHNAMYALPYARRFGIPLVVSFHGRDVSMLKGPDRLNPGWWHYTLRYKRLFEEADLMLAASKELKALLMEAGAPEDKITVHRLGIDMTRFKPRSELPSGQPVILMVGRLVEKKGFGYAIRALASVHSMGHDVTARIIGDGPLRPILEDLVRSVGLDDRIHFLGALPHDEVLRHLSEAYAVLTPSITASNLDRESGLIVAKEACAMALPVIGTWHGGIPEIIDDGKTGFLVPERDHEALADRLSWLLDHPTDARDMGRAGRRKMEETYDIRTANKRLESIYESL